MGKAFEENEFTHNLGLDQKSSKKSSILADLKTKLKTFWHAVAHQGKKSRIESLIQHKSGTQTGTFANHILIRNPLIASYNSSRYPTKQWSAPCTGTSVAFL